MYSTLISNPNLTLKQKLSQHWQDKQANMVANNSKLFNNLAPMFLYFVLLSAVPWAMVEILPTLYGDSWMFLVLCEIFTFFGFIHVVVNWILLWRTESTYDPNVHGTEAPSDYLRASVRNDVHETAGEVNGKHTQANEVDFQGSTTSPATTNSDGDTYQVYVATGITSNGDVQRKKFTYWSWKPCLICQRPRPPRCHHCTLCNCCVLKRDHHCFFGRNCVGFNNQRFFLFFLAWDVVMCSWGTFLLTPYVFVYVLPEYSYWDIVWPVNVYHALTGSLPLVYLHLTSVNLGCIALLIMSSLMLGVNIYLLLLGVTSFEKDEKVKVADTRSFGARLRAVLGKNWGLSLLIPGYTETGPIEDPVYWPYHKVS